MSILSTLYKSRANLVHARWCLDIAIMHTDSGDKETAIGHIKAAQDECKEVELDLEKITNKLEEPLHATPVGGGKESTS